ncbi:LytTR family DNA-binding domain-containing protein [uncultured Lactobacillus sp.]|uniref:LytTR family DNA-binding domain-containing protein n=1 Tax=uncultured Lactobacillus sp. TaxID=153152 RepID=UPI002615B162|nr:LytTR family DNA-binding domain-containing protein [uncultured Lactobacillus sp.]
MKFELFIKPHEEEFVQAQVHQKSSFTDQLAASVPANFWQIDKSAIANRKQIARFTTDKEAGVNVIFQNGLSDYVSRRCFSKIRKELES